MKISHLIALIIVPTTLAACQASPTPTSPSPTPFSQQLPTPDTGGELPLDQGADSPTTSTMLAGSNAIFVNSQLPGDTVKINTFMLQEPGYIVIHRNQAGQPGEVIGHSELLSPDESQTTITLDQPTQNGDELFAMLHTDDGDGEYEFPGSDTPILDEQTSEPVMMSFAVSNSADDEPIIMP